MESSVDKDNSGPNLPDPLASSVKCSVIRTFSPADLPKVDGGLKDGDDDTATSSVETIVSNDEEVEINGEVEKRRRGC